MKNILKKPLAEDGVGLFIPTLNNKGYATTFFDKYSLEFLSFSGDCKYPVLEIGAGYGVATLAALSRGATVFCNDLELRHLAIIESKVPSTDRARLNFVAGAFPDEINFPLNYFSAILIARVLHFFDGETIERSLRCIYEWLIPNGKIFIIADTPYLKNLASFLPEYNERQKKGERWPGLITNSAKYVSNINEYFPKLVHPLDLPVLTQALRNQGFIIEKIELFARPDYPADRRLDGRECIGAIAYKQ